MDPDRKSVVSSFYGARKPSIDALNHDYPAHSPSPTGRRDDASSFFTPERSSMDHLNGTRGSAGYNRGSFFHAGREEPLKGDVGESKGPTDAWDVYADFNNAGPRYSTAFGSQPAYTQLPVTPVKEETIASDGKVEMVTVPALGPEWAKDEMYGATKAGKAERKKETRREFWKAFNRGERGLCGRYFTRKVLVFTLFGLCAAVAIVVAFTIPRVPAFAFSVDHPLVNATGSWATAVPTIFAPAVANFSFPAFASLQADTNSNFLPVKFTSLSASVFDLDTGVQIGSGKFGQFSLPAKAFPQIMLPLNFTYIADDMNDPTFKNWYDGCKNAGLFPDRKRPAVKFRLVLDMKIFGLPGSRQASTQISNANCPVELAMNAA
ncbi:hypothetical protein D9619_007230 [Psilocybe cf. subviscida]|uniref:Uncharacterized protein n=1 Tax=Psilocybe cf. subviscida TaxID=2480587 RepID=A0A8H5EWQ4_9AGAR|nr:hypothetical protein D9619_007230 [Psilocybe cf. subviscida]